MSEVWVIRVFVIPGVFFINMAVIMVLVMMISLARRAGQVVGGISGPDLWPDSIATGRLCPALMNRLLINLYPTILHFDLTIKWVLSPRELPKCSPGRRIAHPAKLENPKNQSAPCYQTVEKANHNHTQAILRYSLLWIEKENLKKDIEQCKVILITLFPFEWQWVVFDTMQ